jgi:hypothetical protein
MTYQDMVTSERTRLERTPLWELKAMRLALAYHSWNNTLEEKARAEAVEQIVHGRLARRMKGIAA